MNSKPLNVFHKTTAKGRIGMHSYCDRTLNHQYMFWEMKLG